MIKIEFPMSALEIMQVCLIYFKDKAQQPEDREKAEDYLGKIECIMNGETALFSNDDFSDLHKFVISIYAGILKKGEVMKGKWTSKQWENVIKYIAKYAWNKIETYEASKMIKK